MIVFRSKNKPILRNDTETRSKIVSAQQSVKLSKRVYANSSTKYNQNIYLVNGLRMKGKDTSNPISDSQGTIAITVLILSCCLFLALDCLVGKFVTEETQFKNTGYYVKDIQEFPFFCDDLSLSPDEDDVTFNEMRHHFKSSIYKSRYVCKYRNLTEVSKKFVERKSRLRFASGLDRQNYLQCGNERLRKASGHLSAAFTKVSRHQEYQGKGSDVLIHWDKHPATSFISEVLHYHNGKIKVPEARFYFLYASVLINISNVMFNEMTTYCRFLLRICVNSLGSERTVLHKYQHFSPTDKDTVSSITVGGHVYIGKGEAVYAKVSEASRIIRESVGNTFGILPLR